MYKVSQVDFWMVGATVFALSGAAMWLHSPWLLFCAVAPIVLLGIMLVVEGGRMTNERYGRDAALGLVFLIELHQLFIEGSEFEDKGAAVEIMGAFEQYFTEIMEGMDDAELRKDIEERIQAGRDLLKGIED